jgi:hypothetical protein
MHRPRAKGRPVPRLATTELRQCGWVITHSETFIQQCIILQIVPMIQGQYYEINTTEYFFSESSLRGDKLDEWEELVAKITHIN